MEASTASACLRRPSDFVNSVRICQAPSRSIMTGRLGSLRLLAVRRLRRLLQALDLLLERVDAVHQLLEGAGEGIGEIHLVQVDRPTHPLAVAGRDASRDADHYR